MTASSEKSVLELLDELLICDLHEIYSFMRQMRGEKHNSVIALDAFISKLPALRARIEADSAKFEKLSGCVGCDAKRWQNRDGEWICYCTQGQGIGARLEKFRPSEGEGQSAP